MWHPVSSPDHVTQCLLHSPPQAHVTRYLLHVLLSVFRQSSSTPNSLPLCPFPPHTSGNLLFSAQTPLSTAPFPIQTAKGTAEPSQSLITHTNFHLHPPPHSLFGSSSFEPRFLCRSIARMFSASHTAVPDRTQLLQIHKSIFQHNSSTVGFSVLFPAFSRALLCPVFPLWLLSVRSEA